MDDRKPTWRIRLQRRTGMDKAHICWGDSTLRHWVDTSSSTSYRVRVPAQSQPLSAESITPGGLFVFLPNRTIWSARPVFRSTGGSTQANGNLERMMAAYGKLHDQYHPPRSPNHGALWPTPPIALGRSAALEDTIDEDFFRCQANLGQKSCEFLSQADPGLTSRAIVYASLRHEIGGGGNKVETTMALNTPRNGFLLLRAPISR